MTDKQTTEEDLKALRVSRGLTQPELGPQALVSQYENGRREPGPRAIKAMSIVLKVDPKTVYAACRESLRRASTSRPSAPKRTRRAKG
jgi:transcriptional regulator with XRE-family HTH domain